MTGWIQVAVVLAVLAAVHIPLGDWMWKTFTSRTHWRVERLIYRVARVDPDADQRPFQYGMSLLGFSFVSVLGLYALLRLQPFLPLSRDSPAMPNGQAFNTAVSFVTNTSWQSYAGETALGHFVQMAGIAVQAFLSAVVGLAVLIALIRGLTSRGTGRVGNFWADITRGVIRILLPLAAVGALIFLATGVVQSFGSDTVTTGLSGASQTIPVGPIASYEPIKVMSGDGGGFFNASSAHPYENPTPFSNVVSVILMLVVPASLPRTYGRMVGDKRQGYAIVATMALLFCASLAATTAAEVAHRGTVPEAVGASFEGKETRIGVPASALFATAATSTSDGALNSSYDSFTGLGGGMLMFNMLVGEVTPGGIGTGLAGLLVLAMVAVFLAGLMTGRTPTLLGKTIGRRELVLVALYILVAPGLILTGTAFAVGIDGNRDLLQDQGPHGFSEAFYAFISATATNGSAFAGITSNSDFYNNWLAIAMLFGRFLPLLLLLGLAGAFAAQQPREFKSAAVLPTHSPTFVFMLMGVVILIGGLSYLPALAVGPLADGLATFAGR